jgi:hypothetical protein
LVGDYLGWAFESEKVRKIRKNKENKKKSENISKHEKI